MLARRISSFVLFAVFCAVVAYWVMVLRAPEPVIVPAPPPVATASAFDQSLHARLFGGAAVGSQSSNVRVIGVIATGPNQPGGVAILSLDGKPARAYRSGQTIEGGQRVGRVGTDRVVLDQGGTALELAVPRPRPGVGVMNSTPGASTQGTGAVQNAGSARVLSAPPQYQPMPQAPAPPSSNEGFPGNESRRQNAL